MFTWDHFLCAGTTVVLSDFHFSFFLLLSTRPGVQLSLSRWSPSGAAADLLNCCHGLHAANGEHVRVRSVRNVGLQWMKLFVVTASYFSSHDYDFIGASYCQSCFCLLKIAELVL